MKDKVSRRQRACTKPALEAWTVRAWQKTQQVRADEGNGKDGRRPKASLRNDGRSVGHMKEQRKINHVCAG